MPVERVTVLMGDTNYPPTDGSGGSFGAATSGAAVLAACRKLKAGLASGMTEAEGSVTPAALERALFACRLRRTFRRSGGASRHRRGACPTDARRIRGRPHPQCEDGALADDRRHDVGHRIGADGGEPRRPALRLLHQPGSGELPRRCQCRRRRDGCRVSAGGRSHGSPLGSKGIGELGICGAGAAVINAIHNATGARIRDFPATPDKLLATLEALDG